MMLRLLPLFLVLAAPAPAATSMRWIEADGTTATAKIVASLRSPDAEWEAVCFEVCWTKMQFAFTEMGLPAGEAPSEVRCARAFRLYRQGEPLDPRKALQGPGGNFDVEQFGWSEDSANCVAVGTKGLRHPGSAWGLVKASIDGTTLGPVFPDDLSPRVNVSRGWVFCHTKLADDCRLVEYFSLRLEDLERKEAPIGGSSTGDKAP